MWQNDGLMSAKLDIFNDIVTALALVTEIKTVELWNNQFANEEREAAFNYPAVFIEFAETPWTISKQRPPKTGSQGNTTKEQKSEGTIITIHLGFSQLENETVSFPLIDPIIEKVYFAIQGLNGTFYGPLLRIAERQDTDHDRVIDWQSDFIASLEQCGQLDDSLTNIPGGTISIDVNVDLDIDVPTQKGVRTGDGEV